MKIPTLFPLLTLLSLTLAKAEITFLYKSRTKEARKHFDEDCVQKAIAVQSCGMNHLNGPDPASKAAYESCIKNLKLPAELEPEVLTLQRADFSSQAKFEEAYHGKLTTYAEKLDEKFNGPVKPVTLEFSFNFIALLLIPVAFGIIYFLNKFNTAATTDAADNVSVAASETV